jgi:hypothetical protein
LRIVAITSRAEDGATLVSTTTMPCAPSIQMLFASNARPGGSVRSAA